MRNWPCCGELRPAASACACIPKAFRDLAPLQPKTAAPLSDCAARAVPAATAVGLGHLRSRSSSSPWRVASSVDGVGQAAIWRRNSRFMRSIRIWAIALRTTSWSSSIWKRLGQKIVGPQIDRFERDLERGERRKDDDERLGRQRLRFAQHVQPLRPGPEVVVGDEQVERFAAQGDRRRLGRCDRRHLVAGQPRQADLEHRQQRRIVIQEQVLTVSTVMQSSPSVSIFSSICRLRCSAIRMESAERPIFGSFPRTNAAPPRQACSPRISG